MEEKLFYCEQIFEMVGKIDNARWLRTIYVFVKTLLD